MDTTNTKYISSLYELIHFILSYVPELNFDITTLSFSDTFNHPIQKINWSLLEGIKILRFGKLFNQTLDNIVWPDSLQEIHLNERHTASVENLIWTPNLKLLNRNFQFFVNTPQKDWPRLLKN